MIFYYEYFFHRYRGFVESNMNYQTFLDEILEVVKEKVEQGCKVYMNPVLKNNGLERDAIVILKEGENISPNIYLDYYFDRYCDGESLDEIGDEIIIVYNEAILEKPISTENYLNFNHYQDSIFYRVVHFEKNEQLLQEIPHIRYLDLAITFHCMVNENQKGIQSYCISQRVLEYWGITKEELYQLAMKNTPFLFPPQISTMENLLFHLETNGENSFCVASEKKTQVICSMEEYEQYLEEMMEEFSLETEFPIYVISNQNGVNGAATILYPELLQKFAEKCNSSFYLLPSSIHEILVIPEQEGKKEELKQMVYEVNNTHVAKDEILSYSVYYYDWNKRELCL